MGADDRGRDPGEPAGRTLRQRARGLFGERAVRAGATGGHCLQHLRRARPRSGTRDAQLSGGRGAGTDQARLSRCAILPNRWASIAAGLEHTVALVNALAFEDDVDDFGRQFHASQMLLGPYYGVQITGALLGSEGGLAIDAGRPRAAAGRQHTAEHCSRRAVPHADCRATVAAAISRATACWLRWSAAALPAARRRRSPTDRLLIACDRRPPIARRQRRQSSGRARGWRRSSVATYTRVASVTLTTSFCRRLRSA